MENNAPSREFHIAPRSLVARCLVVLSTLPLQACSTQHWVGQAHLEPNTGWQIATIGSAQRISRSDISIFVKASNSISPRQDNRTLDYLGISLYFYTNMTDATFDPNEVSLQYEGRPGIFASSVRWGSSGSGASLNTWKCFFRPQADSTERRVVDLEKGMCFEFYFDVSHPTPDSKFTLHVGDIRVAGSVLVVPDLYFRKGSYRVMEFITR
jgi:hypothetical protein